jgi:hypothetical protein
LLVNKPDMIERAEFIRDKGTDRIHFNKGLLTNTHGLSSVPAFSCPNFRLLFYSSAADLEKVNQNRIKSWNFTMNIIGIYSGRKSSVHSGTAAFKTSHVFIYAHAICRAKKSSDQISQRITVYTPYSTMYRCIKHLTGKVNMMA